MSHCDILLYKTILFFLIKYYLINIYLIKCPHFELHIFCLTITNLLHHLPNRKVTEYSNCLRKDSIPAFYYNKYYNKYFFKLLAYFLLVF